MQPDDVLGPGDLERLLGTYAIERQDEQHTAALMGALIGTGLAFVIATTAFLSSACYSQSGGCNGLPDALVVFAPLPAWVLGGLLTFHASASQVRQQFIVELEEEMARRADQSYRRYPRFTTLQLGLYQLDRSNLRKTIAAPLLSILTLVAPIVVILVFTSFVIWAVGVEAGVLVWLQIAASIVYLGILGLNLWVMFWIQTHLAFLHDRAELKLAAVGKARVGRNTNPAEAET